MIGGD